MGGMGRRGGIGGLVGGLDEWWIWGGDCFRTAGHENAMSFNIYSYPFVFTALDSRYIYPPPTPPVLVDTF